MSNRIIIAPASWEPRFLLGLRNDIATFAPEQVFAPYSAEYATRTEPVRTLLRTELGKAGIEYQETSHHYSDPVELYRSLGHALESYVSRSSTVLFNGTTAPREVIWHCLRCLSGLQTEASFSYYRPQTYGAWLSRDAQSPRLVIKHSGIAFPELPTCILALSGFDDERLWQLRQKYEPKMMLVGCQTGDQLGNLGRNKPQESGPKDGVTYFDFDCYDVSNAAITALIAQIAPFSGTHNIIAASLGPKPSAVTLFKLVQQLPEIGLVYIPAGEYSEDYSSGVDLASRVYCSLV